MKFIEFEFIQYKSLIFVRTRLAAYSIVLRLFIKSKITKLTERVVKKL